MAADRLDVFQRVPQLLLDHAGALDQRQAVGGQADAAHRARQQRHAQFALQLGDGLGQRGLRDMQRARRFMDAAVLGHGQQDPQLVQLHCFRFLFQGAALPCGMPRRGATRPIDRRGADTRRGPHFRPFAASAKALQAPFSSFPDTGPTPVMTVIRSGYQDENI
ncbi:hypothetical protein D3C72_1385250 [compost metagenome]